MSILSTIEKIGLAPSVFIGNKISGAFGVQHKTTTSELQATTAGKILGLAVVGTAGALGATLLPSGSLTAVGSKITTSAIQHPIQTAVGGLVGVPLIAGAISEKPSLLTTLPEKAFESGQGLANTVSEHPVATAVIGSITGGVAGYELYNKYFGSENKGSSNMPMVQVPQETGGLPSTQPVENPQMVTGSEKAKRTRKKTRSQARNQTISQKVNLNVIQNNSVNRITKKYLNRVMLTN